MQTLEATAKVNFSRALKSNQSLAKESLLKENLLKKKKKGGSGVTSTDH